MDVDELSHLGAEVKVLWRDMEQDLPTVDQERASRVQWWCSGALMTESSYS